MSTSGEDSNPVDAWLGPNAANEMYPGAVVDEAIHRQTVEELINLQNEVRHAVDGMRMEFGSYWVRRFLLRRSIRMPRFRAILMESIRARQAHSRQLFNDVLHAVVAANPSDNAQSSSTSPAANPPAMSVNDNDIQANLPDNPWGIDNGEIINISSDSGA